VVCPLSLVECVHRSTKVASGGELLEGMPSGCCAWSAITRSGNISTSKSGPTLRCYQIHSLKINKSNTELWLLGLPGWQLIFQKGLIIISFIFLPINIPSQHIQDTFGLEARWIVQSEAPGTLVICIALYSPVNMRILYLYII
jgi:hypothetical protein